MRASEEVLRRADVLFAVWDGGRPRGSGGTADVVGMRPAGGGCRWWSSGPTGRRATEHGTRGPGGSPPGLVGATARPRAARPPRGERGTGGDAAGGDGGADPTLPALGEWDGPVYGELGVLATDGTRLECHACGGWYVSLAGHALPAHGLARRARRSSASRPRRPWPAAPARPPAGAGRHAAGALPRPGRRGGPRPDVRAAGGPHAGARPAPGGAPGAGGRPRARAAPLGRRAGPAPGSGAGSATRRPPARGARRPCGTSPTPAPLPGGLAVCRERLRDPADPAAVGRRISERKGGRVQVTCAVCGRPTSGCPRRGSCTSRRGSVAPRAGSAGRPGPAQGAGRTCLRRGRGPPPVLAVICRRLMAARWPWSWRCRNRAATGAPHAP